METIIPNINDKVQEIADTVVCHKVSGNYVNDLRISGFIFTKPKFITHPKTNVSSCSFIIVQINVYDEGIEYKTFNLMTYIPEEVEELKKINCVTYVGCSCNLQYQPKLKTYYPMALKTRVVYQLPDIELLPPYEKKKQS